MHFSCCSSKCVSACRARELGTRSWSGLWYPAARLTCWKSRVNSRGNMGNLSITSSRQVLHLWFYIMGLCSSLHWICGTTRIHGRCVRGCSESIVLSLYYGKAHLYLQSPQLVQFLATTWQLYAGFVQSADVFWRKILFTCPYPQIKRKDSCSVIAEWK